VQLMCSTFVKADSPDANTSLPIGFVMYACDYDYTASNVVAMIVIINRQLQWISWKVRYGVLISWKLHGKCILWDSFDPRCKSVTYYYFMDKMIICMHTYSTATCTTTQ